MHPLPKPWFFKPQVVTGRPKEETEVMRAGTAVHARMEAEVVTRVEVEAVTKEVGSGGWVEEGDKIEGARGT